MISDFFSLVLTFVIVCTANSANEMCNVERKADLGLAEYKPGAVNLRTDYDVMSAEECFQRCCTYSDDVANHCNAVSFYLVANTYPVCVLLSCVPFGSCVWIPSVNSTAARIQLSPVMDPVQLPDALNQGSTLNQSAVAPLSPVVSVSTTPQPPPPPPPGIQTTIVAQFPGVLGLNSTPAGSRVVQEWNVNNGEVPHEMAAPESAAPDSTMQDQPGQPFNQPEQSFNQPEQQPEQGVNQPEQSLNDILVPDYNPNDWQGGNGGPSPPQNQEQGFTPENAEQKKLRPLSIQSPGVIIGLCSALGVSFLVLLAICRKVYEGQDKLKYKPLRDYDIRFDSSASSAALLP